MIQSPELLGSTRLREICIRSTAVQARQLLLRKFEIVLDILDVYPSGTPEVIRSHVMTNGPNSETDCIRKSQIKKKNHKHLFPILPVTTYPSHRFKQIRNSEIIKYSRHELFSQNALGLRDSTGDGGGGGGYSNAEGDALLLVGVVVAAVPVPVVSATSRDLAIRAV